MSGTVSAQGLTSASLGGDETLFGEVMSEVRSKSWETGFPTVGHLAGLWGGPGVGLQQVGGQREWAALHPLLLSPPWTPQLSGKTESFHQ